MSFSNGPKGIVTEGLIFAIDAANPQSYTSGSDTIRSSISFSNTGSFNDAGASWSPNNGGVFTFGGAVDYINFGTSNFGGTSITEFTVECWAYADDFDQDAAYVDNYNDGQFWLYTWTGVAGYLRGLVSIQNGTDVYGTISDAVIPNGQWNHLCMKWSASDAKIRGYINGVLQTTTVTVSGGTSLEDRTGNFWIGGDDDLSFWFDGKIGPTRIWNNWLTDDQVLQNYNSQKARFGL